MLEHTEQLEQGTYSVLFFVEHKGSDGPTLIGAVSSLSTNADGSTANAQMVDSARNSTGRGRHCVEVMKVGNNQSG